VQIVSAALTDLGRRRPANEDSHVSRPALGLYGVCDGMGGHAAGEVASRVAADAIESFVQHTDGVGRDFTWPVSYRPELGVDGNRLVAAFTLANRAIHQRVIDEPALRGMATTGVCVLISQAGLKSCSTTNYERGGPRVAPDAVVAPDPSPLASSPVVAQDPSHLASSPVVAQDAVVAQDFSPASQPVVAQDPSHLASSPVVAQDAVVAQDFSPASQPGAVSALVAHVGDSRAYLWRAGYLEPITRDHSWVEEQISAGVLSQDEARTHPWRNLVTRALAGADDPDVELTPVTMERGDRILVCSDGLTSPLTNSAIAEIFARTPMGRPEELCQALVDAANNAGGPDNITVIVIEVS
jgi:serine/threonine protein phosphatase PrpC